MVVSQTEAMKRSQREDGDDRAEPDREVWPDVFASATATSPGSAAP